MGVGETSRYKFLEMIGRGGMGEVYRARAIGAHGFEKVVAIKRLSRAFQSDPSCVERLVAEAKILVSLQHGNLVSIIDLARTSEDVFLVLEYVDGPNLDALLNSGNALGRTPFPPGLATHIVCAACEGIAYAHERPTGAIVHADLSPSNLLLTRAGEVKVTDFGIARREGARGRTGVIEGKWAYMSPEQARGEPLDVRSDVFSMGVVLYEALTCLRPFRGESPGQILEQVIRAEPLPPRDMEPDLPKSVEEACLRALAPSPADRFPRMRDLATALREVAFAERWREGPTELARLIGELMPPEPSPERVPVEVLSRLGIGAAKSTSRRTASPDLLGFVATQERTSQPSGVTHWTMSGDSQRLPRRIVAALAGVLVILGIVAYSQGWMATSRAVPDAAGEPRSNGPRTASPPVAATPPDPPDLRPISVPSARQVVAGSVEAPPVVAAPDPGAAQPLATPSAPPPQGEGVAAPVRDPIVTGVLRIHSEPWAEIWVDGRNTGRFTPISDLSVREGRHRVSLRNLPLGVRRDLRVVVRAGETQTIRVTLVPP